MVQVEFKEKWYNEIEKAFAKVSVGPDENEFCYYEDVEVFLTDEICMLMDFTQENIFTGWDGDGYDVPRERTWVTQIRVDKFSAHIYLSDEPVELVGFDTKRVEYLLSEEY